jgi:phospholipid transport system transporter-binding protein
MTRVEPAARRCRLDATGEGRYALVGDLGIESAAGILARGDAAFAGQAAVEVDLSGVADADSAGLAILIEWARSARHDGRRIAFRGMPKRLGGIARISGVLDLLPMAA